MRKIYILFALATLTACGNSASNDAAKTPKADTPAVGPATTKKETPPPPMDSATAAKKYMEYMTPGDMHKMLASSVGTWTSEYTMWEKENGPAQKSTGTCENKMILGGRFIESHRSGTIMGKPLEGLRIMGYDNGRKVFVSSWQDNMSTGVINMEGLYDAASKTITMKGIDETPVTGKTELRQTYKMIDDKTQVVELYGTEPGKPEVKYWEMKLTKK